MSTFNSVIGVLPVTDHTAAVAWYQTWIGREPDVVPTEGVAEWQLAENAWIQVTTMANAPGKSSVVVGVDDLDEHRQRCASASIEIGEVEDLGFIRLAESVDPAGNSVVFVQEMSAA